MAWLPDEHGGELLASGLGVAQLDVRPGQVVAGHQIVRLELDGSLELRPGRIEIPRVKQGHTQLEAKRRVSRLHLDRATPPPHGARHVTLAQRQLAQVPMRLGVVRIEREGRSD